MSRWELMIDNEKLRYRTKFMIVLGVQSALYDLQNKNYVSKSPLFVKPSYNCLIKDIDQQKNIFSSSILDIIILLNIIIFIIIMIVVIIKIV